MGFGGAFDLTSELFSIDHLVPYLFRAAHDGQRESVVAGAASNLHRIVATACFAP